jgi:site-specific recombinase XerD
MKLSQAVREYVEYKQALGMRFHTEAVMLQAFCRALGAETALADITEGQICAYLNPPGPLTRFRQRKREVLTGFNRFVMGREYTSSLPISQLPPPQLPSFLPYIFTREELRRLLEGVPHHRKAKKLQPHTLRLVLLLLYGTGLRISELVSLTLADVDLPAGLLTVRDTKFYKTRLVALGPQLTQALTLYAAERKKAGHSQQPEAAFFVLRSGAPANAPGIRDAFASLRDYAGIRHEGTGQRPRLHDLRHSFAVHRLVSWYQQGKDVQDLLPDLAVYLGHVSLASTQLYLTLTPELLEQASARFERYALAEVRHD